MPIYGGILANNAISFRCRFSHDHRAFVSIAKYCSYDSMKDANDASSAAFLSRNGSNSRPTCAPSCCRNGLVRA